MAFVRALCFVLLVSFAAAWQPYCSSKCPPKCPPMWTFYNGNCYRYFGTAKTFNAAESHCQQFTQVGHGHLASVASAKENTFLFAMWKSARTTTTGGLWIGFTDQAVEGKFIWTDGSQVSYTRWSSGQPDDWRRLEDCTHMWHDRHGQWNDNECGFKYSYMCKMSRTSK
ncbi:alpha-N-acetylgalactosamine-specific lectin-like [Patiria miniata]|uniref:C-type lectin domain-containing protein n=1 Tax=Patiria miniata TaxID=46514 RepID=A0A913ZV19_PATMI|nr:alpha-N-acetylgalactosamine-specific lectin-like [Patiria miniata]